MTHAERVLLTQGCLPPPPTALAPAAGRIWAVWGSQGSGCHPPTWAVVAGQGSVAKLREVSELTVWFPVGHPPGSSAVWASSALLPAAQPHTVSLSPLARPRPRGQHSPCWPACSWACGCSVVPLARCLRWGLSWGLPVTSPRLLCPPFEEERIIRASSQLPVTRPPALCLPWACLPVTSSHSPGNGVLIVSI